MTNYPISVLTGNYPVGSYQKTCANIKVTNDTLSAQCQTVAGSIQKTSLDHLSQCLNSISQNGDIGNINGNLICLPDLPKINNFVFPESETTVNNWVYNNESAKIIDYSWGIWSGLTSTVGKIDGSNIRALETWNSTTNILYQIENSSSFSLLQSEDSTPVKQLSFDLMVPNQFKNISKSSKKDGSEVKSEEINDGDTNIFVSVAYNPPTAKHAIDNKLFLQSTLNRYISEGYTDITNFPTNSITIKPVFKVITKTNTTAAGIYKFPGWPSTPSPAKAFPENDWKSCVYIDTKGKGEGGNTIDSGCTGQTKASTFYLNNFINKRINASDAEFLTEQLNIQASVGDYAILVGMHVTSREVKRWVWQTFWWSANPSKPYLPSSTEIASKQPSGLDPAAQHYAMAVAYQMVSPAQPITKGKSIGTSVIAYNPHLEAGFDKAVFQVHKAINGKTYNNYGVQTNCMSCHNLAMYNPKTNYKTNGGANRETPYGTDFYMSITDPIFDKSLRLDFA
jgi:hypothetical protein